MPKARPIEYRVTEAGCWKVTSHKPTSGGYVKATVDGRLQLLHRWSWEKANSQITNPNFVVRHKCDNPPCINPDHLLVGLHQDNRRDADERGLIRRGSSRKGTKLTEQGVFDARVAFHRGEGIDTIAARNRVGVCAMREAIVGTTWSHVPSPFGTERPWWKHIPKCEVIRDPEDVER